MVVVALNSFTSSGFASFEARLGRFTSPSFASVFAVSASAVVNGGRIAQPSPRDGVSVPSPRPV